MNEDGEGHQDPAEYMQPNNTDPRQIHSAMERVENDINESNRMIQDRRYTTSQLQEQYSLNEGPIAGIASEQQQVSQPKETK